MDSFILPCLKEQVRAVLAEISRLEAIEFPYTQTVEALKRTRLLFEDHQFILDEIDEDTPKNDLDLFLGSVTRDLKESIELLGFLLRSTNLRNAFETHGPLHRIAQKILGNETHLVISSEWSYSPFIFLGYEHIPDFVLIGLPAPESANPFLIPLAGHELGHSCWKHKKYKMIFERRIYDDVLNEIRSDWGKYQKLFPPMTEADFLNSPLLTLQVWKPAAVFALRQAEELFCDFVGLRLFGESYLYAFAYLIGPCRGVDRPPKYPKVSSSSTGESRR